MLGKTLFLAGTRLGDMKVGNMPISIIKRNALAALKRSNCPNPLMARMSGASKACSSRVNSSSGREKSSSFVMA